MGVGKWHKRNRKVVTSIRHCTYIQLTSSSSFAIKKGFVFEANHEFESQFLCCD